MNHASHIDASRQVVREMALFLDTGSTEGFIAEEAASADERAVRKMCMVFLRWLQSAAGKPRLRELKTHEFGSSCSTLRALLSSGGTFANVFAQLETGNIGLMFPEEREELCRFAVEAHTPMRFATIRVR